MYLTANRYGSVVLSTDVNTEGSRAQVVDADVSLTLDSERSHN